jgi:SAM-dependent methyltransferase
MLRLQRAADAPRYLMTDIIEDIIERLSFLRIEPKRALIVGDWTGTLAAKLSRDGQTVSAEPAEGFDEERPFPFTDFDFIASLGTLDTVNDLPGALIHLRNALAPGGLMIASLMGADSLPTLRAVMLAADAERPAPRLHPQVDVRAGGQLLQRTGFADPVIDSRGLDASFRSLGGLATDLRAMGLSNVLARHGPALGKAARARAEEAFAGAGNDGRTIEHFEILTLSGWKK